MSSPICTTYGASNTMSLVVQCIVIRKKENSAVIGKQLQRHDSQSKGMAEDVEVPRSHRKFR